MQKLFIGVAAIMFVVALRVPASSSASMPSCSADDPPVLLDTKTNSYQQFAAASSAEARQNNIAAAKKAMAANPNLKPECKSAAVKAGAHMANGMGGLNAMGTPSPHPGPTTGQ